SHSSKPMVDQRRFSDSAPGNNCNNIDLLVCPSIVQESDVLFTTKKITSCDRQSGYGNLLRTKSCWPLASFDTRSGRGRLLQVLTTDPRWCLDSICDRRYRLQKFARTLKAPPGVLSQGASQVERRVPVGYLLVLLPAKASADAGTSPRRECPGMAFFPSPSPR